MLYARFFSFAKVTNPRSKRQDVQLVSDNYHDIRYLSEETPILRLIDLCREFAIMTSTLAWPHTRLYCAFQILGTGDTIVSTTLYVVSPGDKNNPLIAQLWRQDKAVIKRNVWGLTGLASPAQYPDRNAANTII